MSSYGIYYCLTALGHTPDPDLDHPKGPGAHVQPAAADAHVHAEGGLRLVLLRTAQAGSEGCVH